jgi:hypothetical protein
MYFAQKQRKKYPEILDQLISGQNITNAVYIICNKHKSHIGTCQLHSRDQYIGQEKQEKD